MAPVEPFYWYLPVILFVHLVLVSHLLQHAGPPPGAQRNQMVPEPAYQERTEAPDRESPDTVACRQSGTENRVCFRYCRECIAELPGGPAIPRSPSTPSRRGVR